MTSNICRFFVILSLILFISSFAVAKTRTKEEESSTAMEELKEEKENESSAAAEEEEAKENGSENETEDKESEKEESDLGTRPPEEEKDKEEKSPSAEEEKTEKEEEKTEKEEEKTEKEEEKAEKEEETARTKETTEEDEKDRSNIPPMETAAESPGKQEAPKDTFAVWNHKGKICILAKFSAVFAIKYSAKGGEQKAEITVPETAASKGNCNSEQGPPMLEVSWQRYILTLMFNKTDEDISIVTSMELTYDTTEPLFDGATNAGKITARSKPLTMFETPLDKSYFCPAQEVVLLYSANKQVATGRMKDVLLQAYRVEDGVFSPGNRCSQVVIDGPDVPFVQDETVPLAVGCTLALITLIILVGFSVHRAINAAKVDYNAVP